MRPLALLAALALLPFAPSARAAASYDSCAGFITSLPAVLSTQGTWCFSKDLSTTMSAGEAIVVDANNVTIDCNGFKLGGLGAGPLTEAVGIATLSRLNTTIRNCNVRGFYYGIWADGGGGHLIEDNRLDGNPYRGIYAEDTSGIVRRNLLLDNGARTVTNFATAMYLAGSIDVLDNTIDGVAPGGPAATSAFGMLVTDNPDGTIAGNRIRGLLPFGALTAFGIAVNTTGRVLIRDNQISGTGLVGSVGIFCSDNLGSARDNQIAGYPTGISNCEPLDNQINAN